MKELAIGRAHGDKDHAEPVVISITEPCREPKWGQARTGQAEYYKQQGEALAEALWLALPGGTVDALIAALFARRSSLLMVAFREDV